MSSGSGHPGLAFGNLSGQLRRQFQPHNVSTATSNKPSPSLSQQHASPYQTQAYASQHTQHAQQPPQSQYSHHLYTTTTPPIPSVSTVQNAARQPPTQMPPAMPRQRAPAPRQMQQQANTLPSYLQQSLNQQPIPQQPLTAQQLSQQPMSQPPMSQSLGQQSLTPSPMSQAPLSQALTQQSLAQQSLAQQSLNQQSLNHSAADPASAAGSKVQQVQHVQQQPTPPHPEPADAAQDNNHDDDMEISGHQGESGDDDGSSSRLNDGTPFVPRQPRGLMMSAPPEGGSFATLDAIHKHVLEYCTSVGYAVVIGRSKKTVPGLKKVLFVCDRAGKPPKRVSPEMRKRKTTSRKCDCPFGFFAIEQRTQWTIRYRPDAIHLQHNHGPSESPLLHPAARKLDSKMVAAVKQLKESGVGVTETLEILQQDHPHVPLLPRDIYNARAAINRNPQKVATGLAENRPAIYSKPQPSAEERIRADLRREIAKAREELEKVKAESKKEIDELKATIVEKNKIIDKFEQFIDICNQRVIVRLNDTNSSNAAAASGSS
ncbi:unnamed protein product [Sordaria macrospora k-hell]|uniref:WGS project CABT00000000 data, contig 2.2 n=1 Tax=Sordaria macrospora (strain ATCC MYA-333 / DSM 997 / K(L3346) / K-hell) TaxID=771870 RepID=F7VN04_SORMK|nr:uncharacterized protein SMAC_00762 [Sordaria macrospora k-hell]CCC06733.1 unnamed protein product [Sordaria macrospora k-hell]